MYKNKIIVSFLMAGIFCFSQAYAQMYSENKYEGHDIKIISGKVASVDVEGGAIKVKVDESVIPFKILPQAELDMTTHHMSIIELREKDPVTIKYFSADGKNNIVSLEDDGHEY